MSFLLEYYPPFVQLINTEEYKKELMKFGLSKKSKLTKISMDDAKRNTDDLILFRNHFPTWGSPEAEAKFTVPVKFGKKTVMEQKGVWIGWKKGSQFKVLKKSEAGGHDLKNLYDSDLAYKVDIDPKEILKKRFKEENPDYNKPIDGMKTVMSKGKLAQIKWKNKYIELANKLIEADNKKIINKFKHYVEDVLATGNLRDMSVTFGQLDWNTKYHLDDIVSRIARLEEDKDMKLEHKHLYNEIERPILRYITNMENI